MTQRPWWHDAVIYQVYPRSYQDSNGDGIGDLPGVLERLDHLAWLGVDAIWLNPIHPSPNRDWGYDVADYLGVDPDLGTLADVDRLVAEAGGRGIRVILDLVPNHTSDRHAWFVDARSGRDARHRSKYVWAPPGPDGGPPNNWTGVFGGSAWARDGRSDEYFLHNFLPEQPDLNWWDDGVREAFDETLRFWFDRGIAGFRIDVAHGIVKDAELLDNPELLPGDPEHMRRMGQRHVRSMRRPEVHDVFRRWRRIADAYDEPRLLLGETWAIDHADLARYYGDDDELNLSFNFPFSMAPFEAATLRSIAEETERELAGVRPAWTASNHDIGRLATRWCDGDERKVRCALLALLAMRGTPVLYAGDEIGLPDTDVQPDRRRDPIRFEGVEETTGRDGCRTPMPWEPGAGRGFTRPEVEPWLPFGDERPNVADQRADEGSVLHWTRHLIRARREHRDLVDGAYASIDAPDGVWAWRRGETVRAFVNLSDRAATVEGSRGRVIAATGRAPGETVGEPLELEAWGCALVATSPDAAT